MGVAHETKSARPVGSAAITQMSSRVVDPTSHSSQSHLRPLLFAFPWASPSPLLSCQAPPALLFSSMLRPPFSFSFPSSRAQSVNALVHCPCGASVSAMPALHQGRLPFSLGLVLHSSLFSFFRAAASVAISDPAPSSPHSRSSRSSVHLGTSGLSQFTPRHPPRPTLAQLGVLMTKPTVRC